MPRNLLARSLVVILFLSLFCRESKSQRPIDEPSDNGPMGVSMLKEVEQRVLPLPLVPGVPRYETISDYYWDANVALKYRLDEALLAFNSQSPKTFRAMTVVSGSAGVGKTFVKRSVYNDQVPKDRIWKFDLREMFAEFAEDGLAESKADVVHGKLVINRLLSLTPAGRKEFIYQLQTHSPAFVVVDSLDEVHPDDYYFVLSQLERFALQGDRDFMHVVVFGRPFAFREYWRDRRAQGLPYGLRQFALNPPDFRTTGDLLVSTWNYDCWKYHLSRMDSLGHQRPMSFAEFNRWCELEFRKTGDFSDVTYDQNPSICPQVHHELLSWTGEHRVVLGALPNLAGNSIVRELVLKDVQDDQPFDEQRFMQEFFARWLERDTKSGNRPSRLKPEHLEIYVRLLEGVAAKYVDEQGVSRLGYFDVAEDDHVTVNDGGKTVSVSVCQLLNRSGLVNSDPSKPEANRYRFEPIWIHRMLLEQRQERETMVAEPLASNLSDSSRP